MKTHQIFLLFIIVCQAISCTKEVKEEIKDNLIVGSWSANTEIRRVFSNGIPTKDDTTKYDSDAFRMGFQSNGEMWMHLKGQVDSLKGTYSITGTQLFRSYKQSSVENKDTLNFEVSSSNLRLFNVNEDISGNPQIRSEYEIKLDR